MRLTKHIETLLYRYECVIIPGFGAFLTRRQPARITEDVHEFLPPTKTISFNRQLRENDGLLANYIAKAEGFSYQQSLRKIHNFVDNIKSALEAHGRVRFENIGIFYRQGDKILFHPFSESNYLLEAYGTTAFEAKKIAQSQEIPAREQPEEIAVEPEGVKELPREEKTQDGDEEFQAQETEDKTRPAYWRYAAIGVLTLGLGGFLGMQWYATKVKHHNLAAQQEAEHQVSRKIQQATFVVESPLPEIVFKVATQRGKYHIVAGAFREKENAEKKLQRLHQNGFPHAKYIGENRYGLHQVIYDSFKSRSKAVKELRKIKRENNPAAWLFVKEL